MASSQLCDRHIQTPFATTVHLLVTLFLAASYIPQLIQIATNDRRGTAGISGWYIILLTVSASTHFAARTNNDRSAGAWKCFQDNELEGFDLFSALVVFFQAFIHWTAAIILMILFVLFRTKTSPGNDKGDREYYTTSSPSNTAILAIVLTHAAITLPLAFYFLQDITRGTDIASSVINILYSLFLWVSGFLTSLMACIPQIHLLVARPRDQDGSLSTLSLGLQALAFTALACSQGWRMRPLPVPPTADNLFPPVILWSREWWGKFFFEGLAFGWMALGLSQLVVLFVAIGVGARGGYIPL
ncbi:hypothetical protein BJX99DRAFT_236920 [Aspergillus californicus]